MTTRASSVSPREARNSPGSVPSPERDWTVVSNTTASRVTFLTSPPTGGQSTEHTPELSRFSEHDAKETNKTAVASERSSNDEDFTTSFHVIGSARRRVEAALGASTKLLFRRAYSWRP